MSIPRSASAEKSLKETVHSCFELASLLDYLASLPGCLVDSLLALKTSWVDLRGKESLLRGWVEENWAYQEVRQETCLADKSQEDWAYESERLSKATDVTEHVKNGVDGTAVDLQIRLNF